MTMLDDFLSSISSIESASSKPDLFHGPLYHASQRVISESCLTECSMGVNAAVNDSVNDLIERGLRPSSLRIVLLSDGVERCWPLLIIY